MAKGAALPMGGLFTGHAGGQADSWLCRSPDCAGCRENNPQYLLNAYGDRRDTNHFPRENLRCTRAAQPPREPWAAHIVPVMNGWAGSLLGGALMIVGALFLARRGLAGDPLAQETNSSPAPVGELPVLGFRAIVERTGTTSLVDTLRTKFGLPAEVFEQTVQPVIEAYAEFVQLLPASESDHHAEPGGLFTRGMEIVGLALDYRRGQILPPNAAPEAIGERAHRWTYAVFVAALLHDVGKPIARLRVMMRDAQGSTELWSPLADSLGKRGARSYRVEFVERGTPQGELHQKLPLLLLNRIVPAPILGWLVTDAALARELWAFLSGEPAEHEGAIGALVLRAHRELGRRYRGGCGTRLAGSVDVEHSIPRQDADPSEPPPASSQIGETLPPVALTNEDSDRAGSAIGPPPGERTPESVDSAVTNVSPEGPERPSDKTDYLEDVDSLCTVATPVRHEGVTADAPDAARRFMRWLQQGMVDGSIAINESGALVHFVAEGMLLVSPRVFKEFAKRFGEDGRGRSPPPGPAGVGDDRDAGKSIQRQVLRAGWHVRSEKGVNILTYQVTRGGHAVSQLSGVVIRNPARFVNPVPPANPVLVPSVRKSDTETQHGMSA
jgi:integrating conjugative element relaxase (TIGR03760 family)